MIAQTMALAFGFTVDFRIAGNTLRILKIREFAVDSKGQQALAKSVRYPG